MQQILADDPRAVALDSAFQEFKSKLAEFELGQNQHLKAKSNVAVGGAEGLRFEQTPLQNAKDYLESQLQTIENSFIWSEHQKAYSETGKLIDGVKKKLPNTADYLSSYRDQAVGMRKNWLGKVSDEIFPNQYIAEQAASWTKASLNSALLGGPTNVGFQLVQVIQMINAIPEMVSMRSRLAENVTSAFKDTLTKAPDQSAIKALVWARENHVIKAGQWEELGSTSNGPA
jgi:hypothetical protein